MRQFNFFDVSMYQIQIFLVTAKEKSFSRAAESLNLTQPSLSKRLSALERTIGVCLFNRKTRPISLTKEGEHLFRVWSNISLEFELSLEKVREMQALNKIVLSMIDSGRTMKAVPITGKILEERYPEAVFSWEYTSFTQWRSRLNSGDVDVAMVHLWERGKLEDHMESELVLDCPKLVCMLKTNPLCQKESIGYEDLRTQSFIVNTPGVMPSHLENIRKNCLKHGFEPSVARFAPNAHTLIGSLQSDDEVVICDILLRDIENPLVKIYELPDTPSGLLAVWRKDNKNTLIRPLVEILKQSFKDNDPSVILKNLPL